MNEREEVNKQWLDFVKSLREDVRKFEKYTKEQYINKGLELTLLKIEHKIIELPLTQISSYLFMELNKEVGASLDDPVFSKRYIQMVLPSDYKDPEKRNYLGDEIGSSWTPLLETDQYKIEQNVKGNTIRINGEEYSRKIEPKTDSVSKTWDSSEEPERTEDDYTKLLLIYSKCGSTIERIFDALRDRYFSNGDAKKEIRDYYQNFKELTEENIKLLAKLQNSKSLLDDRNRWGDYEKIIMKFLIDTGETTAHLAKAVGYCSKYGSIGIDRNEDLDYVDNPKLRKFLKSCPSCGVDIADLLNQDLQRYHLEKELMIVTPKI